MEFVIAAIVAAVLFADWPIDSEALRKRLFTIVLAFAFVGLIAAAGTVISPGEGDRGASLGVRESDEATAAQALVERQAVAAMAAFGLAGAAFVWWFRYQWLAMASMMSAAILLLIAALNHQTTLFLTLTRIGYSPGGAHNLLFAGVLGAGVALLVAFGMREWGEDIIGGEQEVQEDVMTS